MGLVQRSTRLPFMYGVIVCTVTIGTLFVSSSIDRNSRSRVYRSYTSAAQRGARKLMEPDIISDEAINVLENYPLHYDSLYEYSDSERSDEEIARLENLVQFGQSSYDYESSFPMANPGKHEENDGSEHESPDNSNPDDKGENPEVEHREIISSDGAAHDGHNDINQKLTEVRPEGKQSADNQLHDRDTEQRSAVDGKEVERRPQSEDILLKKEDQVPAPEKQHSREELASTNQEKVLPQNQQPSQRHDDQQPQPIPGDQPPIANPGLVLENPQSTGRQVAGDKRQSTIQGAPSDQPANKPQLTGNQLKSTSEQQIVNQRPKAEQQQQAGIQLDPQDNTYRNGELGGLAETDSEPQRPTSGLVPSNQQPPPNQQPPSNQQPPTNKKQIGNQPNHHTGEQTQNEMHQQPTGQQQTPLDRPETGNPPQNTGVQGQIAQQHGDEDQHEAAQQVQIPSNQQPSVPSQQTENQQQPAQTGQAPPNQVHSDNVPGRQEQDTGNPKSINQSKGSGYQTPLDDHQASSRIPEQNMPGKSGYDDGQTVSKMQGTDARVPPASNQQPVIQPPAPSGQLEPGRTLSDTKQQQAVANPPQAPNLRDPETGAGEDRTQLSNPQQPASNQQPVIQPPAASGQLEPERTLSDTKQQQAVANPPQAPNPKESEIQAGEDRTGLSNPQQPGKQQEPLGDQRPNTNIPAIAEGRQQPGNPPLAVKQSQIDNRENLPADRIQNDEHQKYDDNPPQSGGRNPPENIPQATNQQQVKTQQDTNYLPAENKPEPPEPQQQAGIQPPAAKPPPSGQLQVDGRPKSTKKQADANQTQYLHPKSSTPETQTNTSTAGKINPDVCSSIKLASRGSLPLVALMSAPGSGNTWTRSLIEHATGIYTGSIYDDGILYRGGFLGENEEVDSGTTIVTKTHYFPRVAHYNYTRAILIIRNPFDAIVSEFNRQNEPKGVNKSHVSLADPKVFKTTNWTRYAKGAADRWSYNIETVLTMFKESDRLLVYYEKMKDDLSDPLRRMVRFLNFPVDNGRLECTKSNSDQFIFHRPKKNIGFDPYTPELTERVNRNIVKARELIKKYHLTPLPNYSKRELW